MSTYFSPATVVGTRASRIMKTNFRLEKAVYLERDMKTNKNTRVKFQHGLNYVGAHW